MCQSCFFCQLLAPQLTYSAVLFQPEIVVEKLNQRTPSLAGLSCKKRPSLLLHAGKMTTLRELADTTGTLLVTLPCSETFQAPASVRFLIAAAAIGGWVAFMNLHNLPADVQSVVAGHVVNLLDARVTRDRVFTLEGCRVVVSKNFGVVGTSVVELAGLPGGTLRSSFRPVRMAAVDCTTVARA